MQKDNIIICQNDEIEKNILNLNLLNFDVIKNKEGIDYNKSIENKLTKKYKKIIFISNNGETTIAIKIKGFWRSFDFEKIEIIFNKSKKYSIHTDDKSTQIPNIIKQTKSNNNKFVSIENNKIIFSNQYVNSEIFKKKIFFLTSEDFFSNVNLFFEKQKYFFYNKKSEEMSSNSNYKIFERKILKELMFSLKK